MKIYTKWFLWMWLLLVCITMPFPTAIIPSVGSWLEPHLWWLEHPLGQFFFGSKAFQGGFYSDSPDWILHLVILVFPAAVFARLMQRFSGLGEPVADTVLWWLASYTLSFFLLYYGFSKVFRIQFPEPEANILFTRFGALDQDILYWSVMGKSHLYSLVTGLFEVIPGVLLLWSKTRRLGALLAWPVLLHVLLINISYGIEVKTLSSLLLLINTVLLWYCRRELLAFALNRQALASRRYFLPGMSDQLKHWIKTTVVLCIIVESLYPVYQQLQIERQHQQRPSGAYAVVTHQQEMATAFGLSQPVIRFFVHSKGYLILQTADEQMHDYALRKDVALQLIKPMDREVLIRFDQAQAAPKSIGLHHHGKWIKLKIKVLDQP